MADRNQPSSFREDPSPECVPEQCPCCQGAPLELVHAAELEPQCAEILCELSRLGLLFCFARNRNCSVGVAGCMPPLSTGSGSLHGATSEMNVHFDIAEWKHVYVVHERISTKGNFLGLEFFDEHHNALYRAAMTPDSEARELQTIAHHYFRRCVRPEEVASWNRMAEMKPFDRVNHVQIREAFAQADRWSAPFAGDTHRPLKQEMGFSGSHRLAHAVLAEAQEEGSELILTVAGGFGRVCTPIIPCFLEIAQRDWLYVGGEGRMLRLDPAAVASYWIGKFETDHDAFSYLEALDCYGDLILRISSGNTESYRYWQSLAGAID